ncbi:hypothetical protein ACHQM5_002854 [Ranunculus cassubicifolius]
MVTKFALNIFWFLFILLLYTSSVQSRFITSSLTASSDGTHDGVGTQSILGFTPTELEKTCEQSYGFLPCTTSVLGNIFHIIVYGYFMFLAAKCLSNGSEHLLEILGPGLVGGLFLPMIAALPDSILILVSGLSGSQETAQTQVLVGMGLLAGSAVILLTVLWGSCLVVAKTDIEGSSSTDKQDTKIFSLTGSGTKVDIWTCYGARIMMLSVIPFIIVQLPEIFHLASARRFAVLFALIAAVGLLISYCIYQVCQPWIQVRKLNFVRHKHVIAGALRHLKNHELGRLVGDDGEADLDFIKKLFKALDQNDDSYLSVSEFTALIIGIKFEEIDLDHDDAVKKIMRDLDTSGDNQVDENEFINGISKWINDAKHYVKHNSSGPNTSTFIDRFHVQTKEEHAGVWGYQNEEVAEGSENLKWIIAKASLLLVLGVCIAAAFAEPLVNTVNDLSTATSIPSFFISFVVLPLLMNSSEATSALVFASRKKKKTSSLTFSEIYGSVTIHNLLCVAVFLAIVYARDLTWNFSAEVLIIAIVCVVMGLFASFRTIFPLWTCFVAFALYPFSLVLVYVLDYMYGWT